MEKLFVLFGLVVFGFGYAQECEASFRPFGHVMGTTCIPEQPQRIASVRGDLITTPLLDFGAPLIASAFQETADGSTYVRGASDIFGEAVVEEANLINLGDPANLEVIVEANPDLIMAMSFQSDLYEELSAIAPTVVIENGIPFFEHLRQVTDAAGLSGAYENRLATYEARIEKARERIGDPASITISKLDIAENGLWYYPSGSALEQVIDDLGFSLVSPSSRRTRLRTRRASASKRL